MSQLAVFLVFSAWPSPCSTYLQKLEYLRRNYRVHLTVVDNGMGLRPTYLSALKPQKRMVFPLRLYPSQVMLGCLEQEPPADICLWWQAEADFNPSILADWQIELAEWTSLQPLFLKSAQAISHSGSDFPVSSLRYQPASLPFFPPVLCFPAEQTDVVRQWAAPHEQMPLMLIGVDLVCLCEVHGAFVPLSAEPALTWPEAQNRLAHAHSAQPLRRKILLESLLRAFPGTGPVVKALFSLLTLAEALQLLEETQPLEWVGFPELLLWACQALFAAGHSAEAIQAKDCLDALYPSLRLPATGWTATPLPTTLTAPRPEALRILILGSAAEDPTVKAHLAPILRLGVALSWREENEALLADFEALVATMPENWILILRSPERLSSDDFKLLQQWLWYPPHHRHAMGAQIQEYDGQGHVVAVRQEPRLFPRSQPPRLRSLTPFLLVSEAEIDAGDLLHLSLQQQETTCVSVLNQVLELCQKQAWSQAFPLFEQLLAQQPEALQSAQVQLLWLHCLLENQAFERFEKGLAECPQHFQNIPDFLFLKGAYLRHLRQWQAAELALEQCLNLRPEELRALPWYSADSLERWPLLALKDLYWEQLFRPELDIRGRQQQVRALRRVLLQLLPHFPLGQLASSEWSLYLYLGCVAILGAHYAPGSSARDLFLQNLPTGTEQAMEVYYIETALLYLAGQFSALPDRLPPGQSYESMRDLQQDPTYLMPFTQTLWQMPEMDGPEMALAFLVCSCLAYRDISYLLWLVRLQTASGQQVEARFSLQMAALIFPQHALLPAEPGPNQGL